MQGELEMEYYPKKSYGTLLGLVMGILIFGFCLWGIGYSLGDADRTLKMMLYIPAYFFLGIYLIVLSGSFNLSYRVNEEKLIVKWGFISLHIPWEDIDHVIQVKGKSNLFSILGMSWPGYIVGLYTAKGLGPVRMYATQPQEGFIYLKTHKGFFGLTPEDSKMIDVIASKAGKTIEIVDMGEIPDEIKGRSMHEDRFYRLLLILNILFIVMFSLYLGIFFPGSGAPRFIILLLVLAIALFFFNIGNAGRLFQFSSQGGYILLVIGIAVTGIFLILSLSEISL